MSKIPNALLVFAPVLIVFSCITNERRAPTSKWTIDSPGRIVRVQLLVDSGQLFYSASFAGSGGKIIEKSPLGLTLENSNLLKDVAIFKVDSFELNEEYKLVSGKRLNNSINASALNVHIRNSKDSIEIQFLVFDDGFAFRYRGGNQGQRYKVTKEHTGFGLPSGSICWMQEYDSITLTTPAYERYFQDGIPAGSVSATRQGWCFPVLVNAPDGWLLLTESNLNGTYYGGHLNNAPNSGMFFIEEPNAQEAQGIGDVDATGVTLFETPWRVVIAGRKLSDVFESNLVNSVAAKPSHERGGEWIQPGRAAWSWWSEQNSPRSFQSLCRFIDVTAEMKWEYFLVDANWDKMTGGTREELVRYANRKNVGVWLWYNSGGRHNKVMEHPRDIMSDSLRRNEEMKKIASWGVRGIKVDFFQSDKQWMIQHYIDILKDAEANHLMVNFHGCTIPRGWTRTYPHLLSMESVKGAESYIFSDDFPQRAPLHNVHLAFSRNIVGPMDYTPVTFSDNSFPHQTSWGHELALSVVFESGVVHFADHYSVYKNLAPKVKELLASIPVVWDESTLLAGHPSSHIVVARRFGSDWYVAAINGTTNEISIGIDFGFLDHRTYDALVYEDSAEGRKLRISTMPVLKGQHYEHRLKPNGGVLLRLTKGIE
jgi:alpha-glucosidase